MDRFVTTLTRKRVAEDNNGPNNAVMNSGPVNNPENNNVKDTHMVKTNVNSYCSFRIFLSTCIIK